MHGVIPPVRKILEIEDGLTDIGPPVGSVYDPVRPFMPVSSDSRGARKSSRKGSFHKWDTKAVYPEQL